MCVGGETKNEMSECVWEAADIRTLPRKHKNPIHRADVPLSWSVKWHQSLHHYYSDYRPDLGRLIVRAAARRFPEGSTVSH